ncbi:bis-aminopropyl spermidine synthase family protein [Clostridium sp. 19966]|uniref:bis-aminopropyl spermidine synthase family protein n=1 Tax=Clostridium sp. 19966 TaxID=2768166 RepID=UPI0028DDD3C2|nr:bis-aminopropyl spermidine synthase family protein [Clostridium sp. 19966]MDT8717979.1 bis-aminopropyl spermidine synthase family protein [Clostridium sp. 19966]
MLNYIDKIYENMELKEGKQVIQNTLINIYLCEGISTKELSRNNLLPLPLTAAIKKEAVKLGLAVQDRGVRLTSIGKNLIEKEFGFYDLNIKLYDNLLNSSIDDFSYVQDVLEDLRIILQQRPSADVTIDQSKCTAETALKRAILCLKYSGLIGKNILCIGDDDFISVALGLLLKKLYGSISNCKSSICVVDIDERILDTISHIAEEFKLPITCIKSDLRDSLNKDLVNNYNCLFTDPPYTLPGIKLFLSRGLEGLNRDSSSTIFLSYGHKSPDFDLSLQNYFREMGLVISEIIPKFNTYEGASLIGNMSQMTILKTTESSKTLVDGSYEKPIYTKDFKKSAHSYESKVTVL